MGVLKHQTRLSESYFQPICSFLKENYWQVTEVIYDIYIMKQKKQALEIYYQSGRVMVNSDRLKFLVHKIYDLHRPLVLVVIRLSRKIIAW